MMATGPTQAVPGSSDLHGLAEAIGDAVREWRERREFRGFTVDDLRGLVREGVESGPSKRASMAEVKAEARRRFEAAKARG